MTERLLFATTSASRTYLLEQTCLSYSTHNSQINEYFTFRPNNPEDLVGVLAKMKTEATAKEFPKSIVIGMDSVAYFNNKILEKPTNYLDAIQRLRDISGQTIQAYTGIHLIDGRDKGQSYSFIENTRIKLNTISDEEIFQHLIQNPIALKIALGFNPRTANFIESIEGCKDNFYYGLPLKAIHEMLLLIKYDIDKNLIQ